MGVVTVMSGSRDLPSQLTVVDPPAFRGGEGRVHLTSDGRYAVKIYHNPSLDKQALLQKVVDLGRNLGDDEQFLAWPLGVVQRQNGRPTVGVITRAVPPTHALLYKLIYAPRDAVDLFQQGRTWMEYLKIARATAAALRTVHGKGVAHGDVHMKNFLSNPSTGETVLIDLDGAIVAGFLPPQVKGMTQFIAPEVMLDKSRPNALTDRHSLAVLVLWTLLFHDVMLPQKCYDEEQKRDDELGYGEYACFAENPNDRRNWIPRTGTPLFRGGILSYKCLTPKLQELTERALIHGLRVPEKRPQAMEWERALAESYDNLVRCTTCRQHFFYAYWLQPPTRRQCPFCGAGVRPPYPAVLELQEERSKGVFVPTRTIVAFHGLPLFGDVAEPNRLPPFSRRGTPMLAQTTWDASEGTHRLGNIGDASWRVLTTGRSVGRGDSASLKPGTLLSFGDGKRLVRVLE